MSVDSDSCPDGDGRFTLTDRAGVRVTLPGVEGMSLMEILRAADQPVRATCGGAAACGTCHVYVDAVAPGALPPVSPEEQWQLEHLRLARANSRLACQLVWRQAALDGLALTLAPEE